MDTKKVPTVSGFLTEQAVISGAMGWIFGSYFRDCLKTFMDTFLDPLLSFDLDDDGEPDMEYIKRMRFRMGGTNIPVGKFVHTLVRSGCAALILVAVLSVFLRIGIK